MVQNNSCDSRGEQRTVGVMSERTTCASDAPPPSVIAVPSAAVPPCSGHKHNVSATSIETVCTDSAIGESESSKRSSLDRRSQSSTSVDWIDCAPGSPHIAGFERSLSFNPNAGHKQLASDDPDKIEVLQCQSGSSSKSTGLFSKNLFSRKAPGSDLVKLFTGPKATSSPSTSALILEDRPPNLPSKSAAEQRKHEQQYREMLESARRKDVRQQKHDARAVSQRHRHELQVASAAHTWTHDLLPNFEQRRNSRQCLELWAQGLPSCVRGRVWSLTVANQLNITKDLYAICCDRARERLAQAETSGTSSPHEEAVASSGTAVNRESTIELIRLDVERTFPSLCIFQRGGPYHELLMHLLGAYACYRPDIGYVQGMSFVAALLLLNLDALSAFIAFANMLNWPLQRALYCLRQPDMTHYFVAYDQYFAQQLPALHEHFDELDIRPDLYLIEWLYTLYAKSLPLDVACRVWDLYLRDGEEVLFNTALGILSLFEDELMTFEFDQAVQLLSHLPQDFDSNKLFTLIAAQPSWRTANKFTVAVVGGGGRSRTFSTLHRLVTQRLTLAADGTATFAAADTTAPAAGGKHNRGPSDTSSIGSSGGTQMKMSKSISGFMNDWLNGGAMMGNVPPQSDSTSTASESKAATPTASQRSLAEVVVHRQQDDLP